MATKFVPAYDKRTGQKLTHEVPESWVNHPRIGEHLSKTPRQKAEDSKNTTTTKAPAAGDKKE